MAEKIGWVLERGARVDAEDGSKSMDIQRSARKVLEVYQDILYDRLEEKND